MDGALIGAIRQDDLQRVHELLDAGANPNPGVEDRIEGLSASV